MLFVTDPLAMQQILSQRSDVYGFATLVRRCVQCSFDAADISANMSLKRHRASAGAHLDCCGRFELTRLWA